jgi:hypothetical protein
MKKKICLLLLSLILFACQTPPTPQIVEVTVIISTTPEPATATQTKTPDLTPTKVLTQTPTPNPCLLWSQVTSDLVGQTVCVRGIIQYIQKIDLEGRVTINGVSYKNSQNRWDFSPDRKGFFTLSLFGGWHPETGKSIAIGDCVALTSEIKLVSDDRTYIYWGTKSTYQSSGGGANYFKHPELQVFEDTTFCE